MNGVSFPNKSEAKQPYLNDWTIGISISESPDLPELGHGEAHRQDALVEFARYLLASGATLAYGGDLRKRGFTEILFDLLKTHNQIGASTFKPKRIVSFLAWPIHLKLTEEQKAQIERVAEVRPLDPPSDLNLDKNRPIAPDSLTNRYVWARCLTSMREEMNRAINARLLLGGEYRPGKYRGKYPGLAEEALIALQHGTPLFLIGGFGGCTKAIIDSLLGNKTEVLTAAYQLADPYYAELFRFLNRIAFESPGLVLDPIDYEELVRFFRSKGISGLKNGLSEEDNRRLFETPNVPDMISLVQKGLKVLSKAGPSV